MSAPRKNQRCAWCQKAYVPRFTEHMVCDACALNVESSSTQAIRDRKQAEAEGQALLFTEAGGCRHAIGTGDVCELCLGRLMGAQ